jgi:hypothetical protein
LCLLLLPRALEGFILGDQARDLLDAQGVVAVEPPRIRYGAIGRLPEAFAHSVARRQAKRVVRLMDKRGDAPRVVVVFHPFQYLLARELCRASPLDCELWYGRWDRYEEAYDAGPALRQRLAALHERTARDSALTFVASGELARLEEEAGREAAVVGLAADSFPALHPGGAVVAVSLGHLGWRTDWSLLRAVCELMPELIVLLIGARHEDECRDDPDFAWCLTAPQLVWLGSRSDEEAARLIECADVGIVPFKVEPFNDAGLPYRILKYARLGRRTVSPDLAGVRTWDRAVTVAPDAGAFAAALRDQAGRRTAPDPGLRDWALAQTAETVNAPLWDRLAATGVDTTRTP